MRNVQLLPLFHYATVLILFVAIFCPQVVVDCDGLCVQVQHADSIDFVLNMTAIRGIIVHDEDERGLDSGQHLDRDNPAPNTTIAKKMFAAVSSVSANLLRNVQRQRSSLVVTESHGIACVLEDPLSCSDTQYWSGMEGCLAVVSLTRLSLFIDVRVCALQSRLSQSLVVLTNIVFASLLPFLFAGCVDAD